MNTHPKPKLNVLLVGIDAYPPPVKALNGCANDVQKIADYLEGEEYFDVTVHKLINEMATKAAIVRQLEKSLSESRNGDSFLFYYSGHGTQEEADPIFWATDPDRMLETLVCYDSVVNKDGNTQINLLADKELRYLLNKPSNSGAHIITIFDCCHSGSNTRNGQFPVNGKNVNERRLVNRSRMSNAFPQRSWGDFVFSVDIEYEMVKKNGVEQLFPEREHIQMAACQNDESAYEVDGEGVFTKNLVDILKRCKGNISYHRLQGMIQSYLRHQFDQTPKIYSSHASSDLFLNFLNKEGGQSPLLGTVSFNEDLGWLLDMGSIQGVVSDTALTLNSENGESICAQIQEVFPTYSAIAFDTEDTGKIEKDKFFQTTIADAMTYGLRLYINPAARAHLEAFSANETIWELNFVNKVTDPAQADYCVIVLTNNLILSAPAKIDVPIVPPMDTENLGQISILTNYLRHLSKFNFVKYLNNPGSFLLRPDMVSIQVFSGKNNQTIIPIQNDELLLEYAKSDSKWGGSIRVKLKNTSGRKLYCALCYLSFNFGVFSLLKAGVEGLEPNQEAWALDGAPIDFKLEPEILEFDYKESRSYLKLLLSTEDFTQQLNTLALEELPSPVIPDLTGNKGLQTIKSPDVVHDWNTRMITVRMPNPER